MSHGIQAQQVSSRQQVHSPHYATTIPKRKTIVKQNAQVLQEAFPGAKNGVLGILVHPADVGASLDERPGGCQVFSLLHASDSHRGSMSVPIREFHTSAGGGCSPLQTQERENAM